jgi:hypothetical protein
MGALLRAPSALRLGSLQYAFADFLVSVSDARAEGAVDNVEHGKCMVVDRL